MAGYPEPDKTYVPDFTGSEDNAVSIHAWRCPQCNSLGGITVPVRVPLTELLPVSCPCGFKGVFVRAKPEVDGRYIQIAPEEKP